VVGEVGRDLALALVGEQSHRGRGIEGRERSDSGGPGGAPLTRTNATSGLVSATLLPWWRQQFRVVLAGDLRDPLHVGWAGRGRW
jgi:hypothetical protein